AAWAERVTKMLAVATMTRDKVTSAIKFTYRILANICIESSYQEALTVKKFAGKIRSEKRLNNEFWRVFSARECVVTSWHAKYSHKQMGGQLFNERLFSAYLRVRL
ncbi:MAG TPA: hypothetical protein VII61_24150, partial [Ktedonobacteraceae bacterium]